MTMFGFKVFNPPYPKESLAIFKRMTEFSKRMIEARKQRKYEKSRKWWKEIDEECRRKMPPPPPRDEGI